MAVRRKKTPNTKRTRSLQGKQQTALNSICAFGCTMQGWRADSADRNTYDTVFTLQRLVVVMVLVEPMLIWSVIDHGRASGAMGPCRGVAHSFLRITSIALVMCPDIRTICNRQTSAQLPRKRSHGSIFILRPFLLPRIHDGFAFRCQSCQSHRHGGRPSSCPARITSGSAVISFGFPRLCINVPGFSFGLPGFYSELSRFAN